MKNKDNTKSTANLLAKMLKENTGIAIMDSGGNDGRAWQRNQAVDFEKQPRIEVYYRDGILEYVTVNLYHYLNEVLELDETAKGINRWLTAQRKKDIDAHWVQECADLLEDKHGFEFKDSVCNTYNYDTNISQVIQFMVFFVGENPYCLLQIHGGADVRGGYTNTQCFKLAGYLTGLVDVGLSTKKGLQLDTSYNGTSLTDDSGNAYKIKEKDVQWVDFIAMNDIYMYA
jgi:hypothetical protein